ncbi:MAG: WD40/YVTN/BNR-like repeat-containing protein [Candidatus Methylomirabilia bacterium]
MKRPWLCALLVAALATAASPSWGNHVFMRGGPFGGVVLQILPHPEEPETLYLASFGSGVFRSVDGGRRWEDVSRGLEDLTVMTLAMHPVDSRVLYAGTDSGLFISRDGGGEWSHGGAGIAERNIRSLVVVPSRPTVLYAATDQGVLWSWDQGRSWAARNTELGIRDVRVLRLDPSHPDRLFAAGFGGVFRSEDGGERWQAITRGLTNLQVRTLAGDPSRAEVLYAGTSGGGVFVTTDGGAHWRALNEGLGNLRVLSLAVMPGGELFAATVGGVYRLEPRGSSWERVGEGPLALTVTFVQGDSHRPGTVYAGTGGLVFVSEDHGRRWRNLAVSVGVSAGHQDASAGVEYPAGTDSQAERR